MSYRYKWVSVLVLLAAFIPQALADSDQDTKLAQLQAERNLLEKKTIRQRAEIAKLRQEIDTLKKQLAAKSADSNTSGKPVPKPGPPKPQADWPKAWEKSFQLARSDVPRRREQVVKFLAEQKGILKRANRVNSREMALRARREIKRLKSGEVNSSSASLTVVEPGALVYVDAMAADSKVRVVTVMGPTTFRGNQEIRRWGMVRKAPERTPDGMAIEGTDTHWTSPDIARARRSPTVFFEGVSTKGLVDEAASGLTGYFITSGTRTGGGRTEYVLTRLDIVKWREAYKNWEKANPVKKKPSRRK